MRFAHPPETAPYQFSAHKRASGRRLPSLSPAQQAYHPCRAFSETPGVHLSKMFELESGYWRAQRARRPEIGICPREITRWFKHSRRKQGPHCASRRPADSRDRALLQALATQGGICSKASPSLPCAMSLPRANPLLPLAERTFRECPHQG